MKMNKVLTKVTASAVAIFVGISPMTVFAHGQDPEQEVIIDDGVTDSSEDASEETPTEEHYGPLTPDGNMDIVDDYGSMEAGGKQFITLVTKDGNYFYLIIDRDDHGNENVHFLNLVDESDLMALMDDEEKEAYEKSQSAVVEEAEPVEPTQDSDKEPTEPEPQAKKPKKNAGASFLTFISLAMLVIGGGAYGFKKYMEKKAKKPETKQDPDGDYDEDEDADILQQVKESTKEE
ncbi:DUF4366 domain-containing protein [Butyrivibrio sp. INlla14]|uniref:DUF4366 domain-containing protein n=1 Tax=Butyrivibrio sp. INlla14 TaxID=1520808 RepID=UPI00087715F9|nr:DUF4366 domain-containing protein [Butyrivibrio sp. INlla14]SCY63162.1 protein of unknown function [Butyrivibrio sp. INlla14]